MSDHLESFADQYRLRLAMASQCPTCGAGPGMKCRRFVQRGGATYVETLTEPHADRFAWSPKA